MNGKRICLTSTGPRLSDPADPRFGRCAYFIFVDEATGATEAAPNDARLLGNGAGIQAAQDIVTKGAGVVITGDMGPNAFRVLSAAGVRVFVGVNGSCEAALDGYRKGLMKEIGSPTAPGHHGGRGAGRGQGMGRGGGWL
ncbi:MAG: NifB/NifX family molybdenum-iron cluster-binding protein [Candidatus Thermoplasmatota archaeon]|nr:NifB/NifX family molybdenum-iron cluster-binding protein [Candidatus Thermoplasmatota archaeon]